MQQIKWYRKTPAIIILIFLFWPVGLYLMWRYAKWNIAWKIGICAFLIIGTIVLVSNPSPSTSRVLQGAPEATQQTTPSYTIKYSRTTDRFDYKPSYYVVIGQVDTSNNKFEQTVKDVITTIAKDKKSIDFTATVYDSEDQANKDFNHKIAVSDADQAEKTSDTIAMYEGGIDTSTGKVSSADDAYSLSFYPAASTSTATIGQFVATVQFKPSI